jgi:hypothetical protein
MPGFAAHSEIILNQKGRGRLRYYPFSFAAKAGFALVESQTK